MHGHTRLELIWTAFPVVILAIIAAFVFYELPSIRSAPAAAEPIHITVEGHQYYWQFDYTDSPDHARSIGTLHVPVGSVVDLKVVSPDVIHSWWIPALGGKIQAIPGRINHFWFRADAPGSYDGQCARALRRLPRLHARDCRGRLAAAVPALPRDLAGDDRQAALERRLRDVPREPRAGRLRPADRQQLGARPEGVAREHPPRRRHGLAGDDAAGRRHLDGGRDQPPRLLRQEAHLQGCSLRERRVAARSEAAYPVGWKNGRVASWLVTVDHKRIGILYIATSLVLLRRRRDPRAPHARAARDAERDVPDEELVQRGHDDARHDDDLPRRRPDPRRLRQLPRAADDRRARHGVPAPERALVLALPARRHRPLAELVREGRRGARRLVVVPDALGEPPLREPRPRPGLLDPQHPHPHARPRCWARSTSSSRSTTCARPA